MFFQMNKKNVFSQFFENLSNGIDMSLSWILSIDEDVIQVDNLEDIELFSQDLIDIFLKIN